MSQSALSPLRRFLVVALLACGLIAFAPNDASAGDEPPPAERVAVGREAPAFSLTGTDGESYAPSDVRGEKNLVLIFFRGTW